jgi:hypothetical protein
MTTWRLSQMTKKCWWKITTCKWTYLQTCIFLVCHVSVWQSSMHRHEHIKWQVQYFNRLYHVSAAYFVQDTVKCDILALSRNRNLIKQKNLCIQREVCTLAIERNKITPLNGIQRNIHPGCDHSDMTNMTGTVLFKTAECFVYL